MTANHQPTTNNHQPMITYTHWQDVPDNLKTRKALRALRLKPAPGQQPVARKSGGYGPYDLFNLLEAVPLRAATSAQQAALEKARNAPRKADLCPRCGESNQGLGGVCMPCREKKQAAQAARDRLAAGQWARDLLAGADFVVLDSETTGLEAGDQVLQLGIVDVQGSVLMETLIRPTCAITPAAGRIHGITAQQVAGAPTMADIWPHLLAILAQAQTIVIYNVQFDLPRLKAGLEPFRLQLPAAIEERCQCAMLKYAEWCGEWSAFHGNYRWQRLPGGDHSAVGDARATLALIRRMANTEDTSP
jgi:DNA polymerase III subunit epsilon